MICHLFDQILVILVIFGRFGSIRGPGGSGRWWRRIGPARAAGAWQGLGGSGTEVRGRVWVRFWPFWALRGQNLRVRGRFWPFWPFWVILGSWPRSDPDRSGLRSKFPKSEAGLRDPPGPFTDCSGPDQNPAFGHFWLNCQNRPSQ